MRQRTVNAVCVAALFAVLLYTYRYVVYPVYDYYGMGWKEEDATLAVVALLANVSIAFLAPPAYRRPSQAFFAIQFLVVFLPASVVCLHTSLPEIPTFEALSMLVAMYLGLLFQTLVHVHPTMRRRDLQRGFFERKSVLYASAAFAVLVLAMSFASLRDIFSISALDSIYSQRDLFNDQSLWWGFVYGLSWLSVLVLPALFIASLALSDPSRAIGVGACVVGYVVLFGLMATKTALFAPLIIYGFHALLKPRKLSYLAVLAIFIAVLLAVPLALAPFESLADVNIVYTGIVNFRIFAVPHLLHAQYLDFFQNHPLTYGSHISVINRLIDYPYDAQVFILIGEEFYPGSNMTANAGMWAQDGIASFGVLGILLISALFTAAMAALDLASEGHDPRQVGAILSMMTLFVSNASLFTTLLTGGLLLAIALLWSTKRASTLRPRHGAHGSEFARAGRDMRHPQT